MTKDRVKIPKTKKNRIRWAHRVSSWLLVLFSAWTIYTGYSAARDWTTNVEKMTASHIRIEYFFILFFAVHIILTGMYFRVNMGNIIRCVRYRKGLRVQLLRLIQNVTGWVIILTAFFVIGSGLIPADITTLQMPEADIWEVHKFYDIFLTLAIVIHSLVGLRFYMMRRRINARLADVVAGTLCMMIVAIILCIG